MKSNNFILFFLVGVLSAYAEKFKVTREWKYINFTWPTEEVYRAAEANGAYIPENNIIAGIKHFDDYFYLSLPRMKSGVPATLARIPAGMTQDTSPLLEPFPSWEMNKLDDCDSLQNVQNVEIDPKGQIWIIDGGRTDTLLNPVSRCPPKLVIFDIKKNATTTAYTFPNNVANANHSFLYDIVVDDTDSGYAYITDNSGTDPGIVVFSVKDHHSWKLRHSQTMKADPTASAFKVNGVMINVPLNIAGIALGPRIHKSANRIIVDEDREVFFCPVSSLHLYSINTTVLRNEMNSLNDGEYQGEVKDLGLKASQTVGMTMNNRGILYYTLLSTNSIAKWDTHTPFQTRQRIIARDPRFLEWPNSFAFDQSGNITVLVNRLNRFIYDKLNLNEPNFRLITAYVGGKSYMYDQGYDYTVDPNATVTTTTENADLPQPEILPGSDNDPYLIPQPLPERKSESEPAPETTPVPEPEPKPEPNSEPVPEPKPEPNSEPEPEPKAEPEPTAEPEPEPKGEHVNQEQANHDDMSTDHDHMNHDNTMEDSKPANQSSVLIQEPVAVESSSSKLVCTLIGVFTACLLFAF
ncbi:yellow-1 [Leptinotarsa decemlineata]|uniref:yellow-1 n=1 Tax=Leptinotarsa decemlineata TaxID=7539 RepID=UPI003D30BAF9